MKNRELMHGVVLLSKTLGNLDLASDVSLSLVPAREHETHNVGHETVDQLLRHVLAHHNSEDLSLLEVGSQLIVRNDPISEILASLIACGPLRRLTIPWHGGEFASTSAERLDAWP
jgi:hypothetical protein